MRQLVVADSAGSRAGHRVTGSALCTIEIRVGGAGCASAATANAPSGVHSTQPTVITPASRTAGLTPPGLPFAGFLINALSVIRHLVQKSTNGEDSARSGCSGQGPHTARGRSAADLPGTGPRPSFRTAA